MIEDVRNEFIRMLKNEPWMDKASSKVAVEKVNIINNANISIISQFFSLYLIIYKYIYPYIVMI